MIRCGCTIVVYLVAAWLSGAAERLSQAQTLSYSTYFGGSGSDVVTGAAVDAEGNLLLTGYTNSTDLPAAEHTLAKTHTGECGDSENSYRCFDVFVAKIDPTGQRLILMTYLGGSDDDFATSIVVDQAGNAYVTGYTRSHDFPVVNASQFLPGGGTCGTAQSPKNCLDAFVAKLDSTGMSWEYATYLGGSGDDFANSIAVDTSGNIAIVGTTTSPDFPVLEALKPEWGGEDKPRLS